MLDLTAPGGYGLPALLPPMGLRVMRGAVDNAVEAHCYVID